MRQMLHRLNFVVHSYLNHIPVSGQTSHEHHKLEKHADAFTEIPRWCPWYGVLWNKRPDGHPVHSSNLFNMR